MKKTKTERGTISYDRWTHITNNVSEEYLDHGQTSFATKAELCETILALRQLHWEQLARKDSALDEILTIAARSRLYHEKKT